MEYIPLSITSRTAQAEQNFTRNVSAFPPDRLPCHLQTGYFKDLDGKVQLFTKCQEMLQ